MEKLNFRSMKGLVLLLLLTFVTSVTFAENSKFCEPTKRIENNTSIRPDKVESQKQKKTLAKKSIKVLSNLFRQIR